VAAMGDRGSDRRKILVAAMGHRGYKPTLIAE
jgi:hypothetical protein